MSGASPQGNGPSSGRKRPRISGMYQRKRAVAACQPCRVRKTKCDNIRPSCGFCTRHEAQCTYADPANDHSSYVPHDDHSTLVSLTTHLYIQIRSCELGNLGAPQSRRLALGDESAWIGSTRSVSCNTDAPITHRRGPFSFRPYRGSRY